MFADCGRAVDSVWEQKKLKARKMLDAKRAAESQRPVHIILVLVQDAFLGGLLHKKFSGDANSTSW